MIPLLVLVVLSALATLVYVVRRMTVTVPTPAEAVSEPPTAAPERAEPGTVVVTLGNEAFTRTATDAVAVAEALTRSVNYPRSVTDALAISDVAARSAALHPRALTDTVTVVDNATSNGGGTPVSGLPPQVPITGAGT